jgi:hypothetical protein
MLSKVGFPVPGCSLLAGAGLTIRIKGCGGFSRPDGSFWHIPAVATAAKDGRSRLESGRWRSAARWLPEREQRIAKLE